MYETINKWENALDLAKATVIFLLLLKVINFRII